MTGFSEDDFALILVRRVSHFQLIFWYALIEKID